MWPTASDAKQMINTLRKILCADLPIIKTLFILTPIILIFFNHFGIFLLQDLRKNRSKQAIFFNVCCAKLQLNITQSAIKTS